MKFHPRFNIMNDHKEKEQIKMDETLKSFNASLNQYSLSSCFY